VLDWLVGKDRVQFSVICTVTRVDTSDSLGSIPQKIQYY